MLPIYISYRPQDAAVVERIVRRCLQTYGEYSVVMHPTRSLPSRTRIEQHVDNLIAASSSVIIVIGQKWAGVDDYGRYLLSSADIPVRAEVLQALRNKKRTFITLVNGATMPPPHLVPDELQGMFSLPVVELREKTFRRDLNHLIHPPSLFSQLRYWFSLDWTQTRTISDF